MQKGPDCFYCISPPQTIFYPLVAQLTDDFLEVRPEENIPQIKDVIFFKKNFGLSVQGPLGFTWPRVAE